MAHRGDERMPVLYLVQGRLGSYLRTLPSDIAMEGTPRSISHAASRVYPEDRYFNVHHLDLGFFAIVNNKSLALRFIWVVVDFYGQRLLLIHRPSQVRMQVRMPRKCRVHILWA
jgi:hypothetical protein